MDCGGWVDEGGGESDWDSTSLHPLSNKLNRQVKGGREVTQSQMGRMDVIENKKCTNNRTPTPIHNTQNPRTNNSLLYNSTKPKAETQNNRRKGRRNRRKVGPSQECGVCVEIDRCLLFFMSV